MKLRLSNFAAAAIITLLSPLPGCSDDGDTGGSEAEGATTGGSTSIASGSGGQGSGGQGSGGDGAGGATAVSSSSSASSTSSAGGSGGGGPTIDPSFDMIRTVVVDAHCSDASCHNGEA